MKLPHTCYFNTTQIYFLIVLEVQSLKSRCQQGHAFSEGSKGECFLFLPGFGSSTCSLGLCLHKFNLHLCFHTILSSSPSVFPLCVSYRALITGFSVHPGYYQKQDDLISRLFIISAKTLFPSKVMFSVSRIGATIQPTTGSIGK